MDAGRLAKIALLAAPAILAALPKPAHAYLDLGSGSYLLQLLLAGTVGLLYAAKSYWREIKARLCRFLGKK